MTHPMTELDHRFSDPDTNPPRCEGYGHNPPTRRNGTRRGPVERLWNEWREGLWCAASAAPRMSSWSTRSPAAPRN